MAQRRSGFAQAMNRRQRELAARQQADERLQRAAAREAERAQRAYEKARLAKDKEAARLYAESRAAETAAKNEELAEDVAALEGLLSTAIRSDDAFDFDQLKEHPELPPFQPGALGVPTAPAPTLESLLPPPLSGLHRHFPGAKATHEQLTAEAHARHEEAVKTHDGKETARDVALAEARAAH